MEPAEVYEAGAAAARLGVSPSGLRRYAALYEELYGELPRKVNTKSRLYPAVALERLAGAKGLVEAGRYPSILEALGALEAGVRPDLPGVKIQAVGGTTPNTLSVLLDELRAVRAELVSLRGDNQEMRAELQKLAALPPADKGVGAPTGLLMRLAAKVEGFLQRFRG